MLMKTALKWIVLATSYLGCLYLHVKIVNTSTSFWNWIYDSSYGSVAWDVVWWGPCVAMTIILTCWFRKVTRPDCLGEALAAGVSVAIAFCLLWIQFWLCYPEVNCISWGNLTSVEFYYAAMKPIAILVTFSGVATAACFLLDHIRNNFKNSSVLTKC